MVVGGERARGPPAVGGRSSAHEWRGKHQLSSGVLFAPLHRSVYPFSHLASHQLGESESGAALGAPVCTALRAVDIRATQCFGVIGFLLLIRHVLFPPVCKAGSRLFFQRSKNRTGER